MWYLVKIIKTEYNGGFQGLGKGRIRSYCLIDIMFQIHKIKRVIGMDGGDGCTQHILYH